MRGRILPILKLSIHARYRLLSCLKQSRSVKTFRHTAARCDSGRGKVGRHGYMKKGVRVISQPYMLKWLTKNDKTLCEILSIPITKPYTPTPRSQRLADRSGDYVAAWEDRIKTCEDSSRYGYICIFRFVQ
eukprot:53884-Prorocentrum_minimum.AAC.3